MPENTKRKKWAKGKIKEKINNDVSIDQELYEKILREIYRTKLSTPSSLTERFHISCSLSKRIFDDLLNKKVLKSDDHSQKQIIFIKNINEENKKLVATLISKIKKRTKYSNEVFRAIASFIASKYPP